MGCSPSIDLSVACDKNKIKEIKKEIINEEQIINEIYNYNQSSEPENNMNNIDNIIVEDAKNKAKNFKSYEKENINNNFKKKVKVIKINKKDNLDEKYNNIHYIEDKDIDIDTYRKYIIKKEKKILNQKNIIKSGNNENQKEETKKNESKILKKSVEEKINKYKYIDNNNTKEIEDSICNLGQSYIIKEKND